VEQLHQNLYASSMLKTARLILEAWGGDHQDAFAAMNADPEVMQDLGGPIDRAQSDAKFEQYLQALRRHGMSRWAILSPQGAFLGYSGVMFRTDPAHPLGPHYEVGWRLVRAAWSRGFATESAAAALDHALRTMGLREVLAYTAPDNRRSQAVMDRLGLAREPSRDFEMRCDGPIGVWRGLVWSAQADGWQRFT
jgi:RimJ/RimL family protein N-acetyltransferase